MDINSPKEVLKGIEKLLTQNQSNDEKQAK
jgi:hypothetical protein